MVCYFAENLQTNLLALLIKDPHKAHTRSNKTYTLTNSAMIRKSPSIVDDYNHRQLE